MPTFDPHYFGYLTDELRKKLSSLTPSAKEDFENLLKKEKVITNMMGRRNGMTVSDFCSKFEELLDKFRSETEPKIESGETPSLGLSNH